MKAYTIPAGTYLWRLHHDSDPANSSGWVVEAFPTRKTVTYTTEDLLDGIDRSHLWETVKAVGFTAKDARIKLGLEECDHYIGFLLPLAASPWQWVLVHINYVKILGCMVVP